MKILSIIFLCAFASLRLNAMDRFAALSMLESGDNDAAVGACGEISRYQIEPRYWIEGNPRDGRIALANAQAIMNVRMAIFRKNHGGRSCNNFEFYVLWNAPPQIQNPHAVVAERARRFENLCEK